MRGELLLLICIVESPCLPLRLPLGAGRWGHPNSTRRSTLRYEHLVNGPTISDIFKAAPNGSPLFGVLPDDEALQQPTPVTDFPNFPNFFIDYGIERGPVLLAKFLIGGGKAAV